MKIRHLYENTDNPYDPMSVKWASYLMAHDTVPEGYFVHGRHDGEIKDKPILQVTKNWNVAEQYGVPFILRPNNQATIVNFDDNNLVEKVASKYVEDYMDYDSKIHPGEINLDEQNSFEDNVEIIKQALTPDNIVDSAQFYDTRDIEWLSDYFHNEPLVIHWDNATSGVIIDPDLEGVDYVQADVDIADDIIET
ncbi:hypothetical protein PBI_SCTP2_33 [Salicola phage SCTP-2]|nr:hypothetical protein PBI_SCTP2_33 [Salicola phage SCTP-2]